MRISSIYIHIPFCLRKCNYCDFVSFPVGEHTQCYDHYDELIRKEFALYGDSVDTSSAETLYFGGGTPSLMKPQQIASLIALFPSVKEITLEANPETLSEEKLKAFAEARVNRLSMGVQSFDAEMLKNMGRGHSPKQAVDMVAAAKKAGFANIGIDLIYGLPGQTLAGWENDLQQAIALDTQHISLYGLSVEPNTPWGDMQAAGELVPVDDDLAADMFELAMDMLSAAGFEHYEISNFARPGFASRHNLAYWHRDNYLGLGVAAAGCIGERRLYNTDDTETYESKLARGSLPLMDEEILPIDVVIGEAIFLGLRLAEGIDFAAFSERYGQDPRRRHRRSIKKMEQAGLLAVDERGMRLTRRGVLLGNKVFEQFV